MRHGLFLAVPDPAGASIKFRNIFGFCSQGQFSHKLWNRKAALCCLTGERIGCFGVDFDCVGVGHGPKLGDRRADVEVRVPALLWCCLGCGGIWRQGGSGMIARQPLSRLSSRPKRSGEPGQHPDCQKMGPGERFALPGRQAVGLATQVPRLQRPPCGLGSLSSWRGRCGRSSWSGWRRVSRAGRLRPGRPGWR